MGDFRSGSSTLSAALGYVVDVVRCAVDREKRGREVVLFVLEQRRVLDLLLKLVKARSILLELQFVLRLIVERVHQ